MKTFFTATLCLFVMLSNVQAQNTLVLQPGPDEGKDALLLGGGGQSDNNFGNNQQFFATEWTAGGAVVTGRSLIDFDFSQLPDGAVIDSAKLSLFAWGRADGSGPHSTRSGSNAALLQRVTSKWEENTVNWTNQPSTTTFNQVPVRASTSEAEDYLDLNVTPLVRDMVASPENSFGMMFLLETEERFRRLNFASSDIEDTAKRPRLVIYYSEAIVSDSCLIIRADAKEGEDAIVLSHPNNRTQNFGDNHQFMSVAWTAGGTETVSRSLIDFNLSGVPQFATIDKATLSLYAWDRADGTGRHEARTGDNAAWLQRITSPWEEGEVNWENQPTTTEENQVAVMPSSAPDQDFENIDITPLIIDLIDLDESSYGLMFRQQREEIFRKLNFCSSDIEDVARRPKLEVCYTARPLSVANDARPVLPMQMYPNPAKGQVTIEILESTVLSATITVFDAQGRVVISLSEQAGITNLNISKLTAGVYFVKVDTAKGVATHKLLVE